MDFHGGFLDLPVTMKVRVVEEVLIGGDRYLQRPAAGGDSTVGLLSFSSCRDSDGVEFDAFFLVGVIHRITLLDPLRSPRVIGVLPGGAIAFQESADGAGDRIWVVYPMEASGLVVE